MKILKLFNINYMKKTLIVSGLIVAIALIIASCGAGAKDKKGEANDIKVEIEKLKKEKSGLDVKIKKLEDKLAKADPSTVNLSAKLVSIDTLRVNDFTHYIELQAMIDADGIAYVAPTGMGGQVKAVYVKAGQKVGKGQLILKLDDAMARQAVIAAQQQTGQLKARLTQAQTVYERYQNLWKQNIGAEIQVINAKADVDALTAQLRAAQAQVGMAQEQVNMSNVFAQMSGVIDEMNIDPGEFFSPQTAAQPGMGIRIVNSTSLKVVTAVPDNYIARVKKGDKVEVVIPETGKPPFQSIITTVGASINPTTRSFTVEAKLPSDPLLKPNQNAVMKILDYEAKAAVAVSINVVQNDEHGKYVYIMVKEGDKMVARKKVVEVVAEYTYNGMIKVKSGLTGGELIITEGYQALYDGQAITIDRK
jgi:membrane fusion protein, multidrug efflux system